MAVVATEWIGSDVVRSDAVPLIRRAVTDGRLVVFTDTAMTQGCPGRADSEESLLGAVLEWMREQSGALSCMAMQLGFDSGGRPRLVLAVNDAGGSACGRDIWRPSDETVQVDASPCTLVTFTDLAGGGRFVGGYDDDIALLAAMRNWVKRHPDFSCDAVQMAHDETGRPQVVLAGAGCTVH